MNEDNVFIVYHVDGIISYTSGMQFSSCICHRPR